MDVLQAAVCKLNRSLIFTVFKMLNDTESVPKYVQSIAEHVKNGSPWKSQILLCCA